MGVLCDPDEEGWSHEAAEALVRVADRNDDIGVVWSIAAAFGQVADPIGVPVLARYARHSDKDVRLLAAQGIPFCRTHEEGESAEDICAVLLPLTEDEDGDVRDWATFGVGRLLESDGVHVRRALGDRLHDAHGDTHWEAVLGLARRHDGRAYELVREGLLGETVPKLAVEAASWLGDTRLLPPLQGLVPWWTDWTEVLETALDRCDPEEQERRWINEALFLRSFEEAVNKGRVPTGFGVAVSCPRVGISEDDVDLDLTRDAQATLHWGLHYLIDNVCGGDPTAAVVAVIAEIPQ